MTPCPIAVAAAMALLGPVAAEAPDDGVPLADLLARAGRYAVAYEETFRSVVAEELSTQILESADPLQASRPRRRVLRSDLVFVILPGPLRWGCFRDVFEVDGQKVRDRDERLERLLLRGGDPSSVERANAILAEGARYNLGARRTANIPTLPLVFLHPSNQGHFRWEIKGMRRLHEDTAIEVRFTETLRPAFVQDGASGDLPASGRFWISSETGAVLRSEVTYEFPPRRAQARMAVEYGLETALHILVPVEMTERYEDIADAPYGEFGPATQVVDRYLRYRRFAVSTEEQFRPEKP